MYGILPGGHIIIGVRHITPHIAVGFGVGIAMGRGQTAIVAISVINSCGINSYTALYFLKAGLYFNAVEHFTDAAIQQGIEE